MNKKMVETEMQKKADLIVPQLKDVFVGFEEDKSLEAIIGAKLTERDKTLAIAESCTGGRIAQAFTVNDDALKYFKGSLVTCTTKSKIDVLGVSKNAIALHSVVSKVVAEAMAKNVRILFNSDYAISTTRITELKKGDSEAELSTVWIAIATRGKVYAEVFNFSNPRKK